MEKICSATETSLLGPGKRFTKSHKMADEKLKRFLHQANIK